MRRFGLACTALTLWCGVAHAQWVVSDPLTETLLTGVTGEMVSADATKIAHMVESAANQVQQITHEVTEINNQITQIQQLTDTIAAVSHGNLAALSDLVPQLGSLGLTSPIGTDMANTIGALSGLASDVSTTSALTQRLLSSDQLFSSSLGDLRAAAMNTAASSFAAQKSMAQTFLNASAQRVSALTDLRNALSNTADVKAAADAGARLAGEQATSQEHTNQILAMQSLSAAQAATTAAQQEQMWRCNAEAMMQETQTASADAATGTITPIASSSGGQCSAASVQAATATASNTPGTILARYNTSGPTPADDGTALGKMDAQSWGTQAATDATMLGVNPTALAATCVMESNCQANPGGTGTISGAFQMSDGTYAQTVREIGASNPDAAALITTKNDPASQALASSQYLKDAANSLEAAGADPTVLNARGYYQFGPKYSSAIAQSSDNQLMSTVLYGTSSKTLDANAITGTTTVGQWRQSVVNKIGTAAYQPILLNTSAT